MEKKNYIAAIDLGSSNVAVLVGGRDTQGRLCVVGHAIKPVSGVMRGEIKNVEQVAQAVKEAVEVLEEDLGIKIDKAYTGISGQHLRCVKHPYYVYVGGKDGEISEDDVRILNLSMRNVQAPDGHRILHISPQHYEVNGEEEVADPVGMFGKTLASTFNLIIGDNSIVSRMDRALSRIGIKQAEMFINPLVTARAVVLPDEKEMGVAVIDIGAGTTDVCIYHDDIVRYVGVVPIGADTINKDIRAYGILERYVEDLKTGYGCAVPANVDENKVVKVPGRTARDPKTISFRNLASIIEARMLDIVDYVKAEIKASGYEGKLGAGIVLTGGGAMLRDIEVLFREHTGLDVRVATADLYLGDDESRDIAASDPRLSTAIGLLLSALEIADIAAIEPRKTAAGQTKERVEDKDMHEIPAKPADERKADKTDKVDRAYAKGPQEPKESKEPRQKKPSWWGGRRIQDWITDVFDSDVIDDQEI